MDNNPNRSRVKNPASNPTPDEIAGMRINAGLTQLQAANVVHSALRSWQHWENGDRRMHPAIFELFLIKTGQNSWNQINSDTPMNGRRILLAHKLWGAPSTGCWDGTQWVIQPNISPFKHQPTHWREIPKFDIKQIELPPSK